MKITIPQRRWSPRILSSPYGHRVEVVRISSGQRARSPNRRVRIRVSDNARQIEIAVFSRASAAEEIASPSVW